jgi:ligand-binding sensor domain-containing protein/two-component sensor histidine kinase
LTASLKKHLLYIFISLFSWLSAAAQTPREFSFAHYGKAEGLSSNDVGRLVQDEQGYIWIGGNNGLQRFDGTRFLSFQHQKDNSKSIPNNFIVQLLLDQKKNLWMVTIDGSVGIFDTRTFTFHRSKIVVQDSSLLIRGHGLVEDQKGNILLLFADYALMTWNPKKEEFSSEYNFIPVPKEWKLIGVAQQPGTEKYWLCRRQGMAIYDRATGQMSYAGHNEANEPFIDAFGHIPIPAGTMFDTKGRVWFYSWYGPSAPVVFCYDLKNRKVVMDMYNLYSLTPVYHEMHGFVEQSDGTIWIHGLGIFASYDEKTNQYNPVKNGYRNERSIDYTIATGLMEDREHNMWVATNNNGLYRFNPSSQFFTNHRHINRGNGLPGEGSPMSFLYTKEKNLIMGTWGDGLYIYDEKRNVLPLRTLGFDDLSSPWIWDLTYSSDSSKLYFASQPGMFIYDYKTHKNTYHNPALMKDVTIRQLERDRFGNLWMGTQFLGLYKWTEKDGQENFDDGVKKIEGIPKCAVHKIMIDKKGMVWINTAGFGLYVIDPATDKIIMHFGMKEDEAHRLLGDSPVDNIQYDDSTIVIAASGLHLYNQKQDRIVKSIPLPESIPANPAAIVRDLSGYIWMAMSEGIFRVNLRNGIFIHFDRVDGIANDRFNIGGSYVLPNGRILFGADNQYVEFDPLDVKINDPAPDVVITAFRLMNQPLSVDSIIHLNRLELGPEDNSIAIDISGLRYDGTYIIKYKLEGLDKDWIRADGTNTAIYSYLPPGTYTFLVRSEDAEGNPSPGVTKLVIRVKPPFWKTWWFLGLIVFAVTAAFYVFDKLRMQRIRATESIRTRIATSLTEDMSNSLSNINISSELAKTKMDTDKDRTREYIGQISDTSNRMVQAMYDMVWSIDPKNDTLADTIERMKSYASEIENLYPIAVDFEIDQRAAKLPLNMDHRYELLSIYKEALSNSGRHSGGRYIKVSLKYTNNKLIMMIIDDGRGFVMDDATMLGRGLTDMRRRAAATNSSIYIESEVNTGTVVKVELS